MRIEYFQTATQVRTFPGQWYWRLVAGNGRIIADGAEAYYRKGNVIRACEKMQGLMAPAKDGNPVPIVEAK